MIKAILFDNGGVLQGPISGNWLLCPAYREILGMELSEEQLGLFSRFLELHPELLPEAQLIDTEAQERELYRILYSQAFPFMGLSLSEETVAKMSDDMTYNDRRVILFDDTLYWLERFSKEYRLGLLSDATPSSKRIVDLVGMQQFFHSETYSFQLGVTKPDARMFRAAIDALGFAPDEILFVDDFADNLDGAAKLGLNCVQMRRKKGAPKTDERQGAYVCSLEELYDYVKKLG